MCRQNHLRGWCLGALGLGILVGSSMESWFLCWGLGVALMAAGLLLLGKR